MKQRQGVKIMCGTCIYNSLDSNDVPCCYCIDYDFEGYIIFKEYEYDGIGGKRDYEDEHIN